MILNNENPYQPFSFNIKTLENFINNQTEEFFNKCCQDLFEEVLIVSGTDFYLEEKVILDLEKKYLKKGLVVIKSINDSKLELNLNHYAQEILSAINYFIYNLKSAFPLWLKYLNLNGVTIAIEMDKILGVLNIRNNLELKSYIKKIYTDYQKFLSGIKDKNKNNSANNYNQENSQGETTKDNQQNFQQPSIEIYKVLFNHIEQFWDIFSPEILVEKNPDEIVNNNYQESSETNKDTINEHLAKKPDEIVNNNQKESSGINKDITNEYLAKKHSKKSKVNENVKKEAENEHDDNYKSGSLIKQIINNIENLTDTDYTFLDKFKVLPSDNNQILNTLEDVKYLLKILEPLSLEVHADFYHEALEFINDKEKDIENPNNNELFTERLLIDCKLYLLHLINIIGLTINDYYQGQVILDLTDISTFLESLKLYKPELEIKLPSQNKIKPKNRTITRSLFLDKNLEPTPTSIIKEILFNHCISPDFEQYKNLEEYSFKITTDNGDIDFIIGETKRPISEQLIEIIGIDTYRVLEVLLTQCLNKILNIDEKITSSGKDILAILNQDNMRDSTGKNRYSQEHTLEWLAEHIQIISRYRVFIGKFSSKNKKSFTLRETNIINILAVDRVYPLDEKGNYDKSKPLLDYSIEYTIGLWMQLFNDIKGKYLNQFGYVHKEGLALNTRNGWAEKIYHWLVIKIEQSRKDPNRGLKVRTIIEGIQQKSKLESILTEPNTSKKGTLKNDLKKELETALNCFTEFKEDPYHWEYKNPPSWITNDKKRKPNGWFDIWLEQVIVIQKPLCLTAVASKVKQLKPVGEAKKPKLTVEDLKKVMAENNVSIRKLTSAYSKIHPWLQRKLDKGNLSEIELQKLIKQAEWLGKKNN